jgi:orotate phosphoribosyltransferase-like protein
MHYGGKRVTKGFTEAESIKEMREMCSSPRLFVILSEWVE